MKRRHTSRAQVGGAMRARTHLLHLRKAGNFLQVCDAAGVHKLSVHNFGIQEYMRHTPETDRVFLHSYSFENGLMHPGEAPGLGVEFLACARRLRPGGER